MKVPSIIAKVGFQLAKHSPAILVGVGVVGVVASAVGACVATKKLEKVVEEHKQEMNDIDDERNHTAIDNNGNRTEVTEQDRKQFRFRERMRFALELVKLYGLPVLGMILSIACILGAHVILKRRNAVLTASLASVTNAFNAYRKRVSDRFGDEVERQIHYNMAPDGEPVTVIDVDENGKNHKSKVQNYAIDPSVTPEDDSVIYFTKGVSDLWKDSDDYNETCIRNAIDNVRTVKDKMGHMFINEFRDTLQVEGTVSGQVCGWTKNDDVDIRYSHQMFKDPIHGGTVPGFVIEIVNAKNILENAFRKNSNTMKFTNAIPEAV